MNVNMGNITQIQREYHPKAPFSPTMLKSDNEISLPNSEMQIIISLKIECLMFISYSSGTLMGDK